jgi:hypothetical protein
MIKVPPGFDPTCSTVLQMLPAAGLHRAVFGDDDQVGVYEIWPIVGWASVMHIPADGLPVVALEPVVDAEDYGPIIASDLTRETGLDLRRVE